MINSRAAALHMYSDSALGDTMSLKLIFPGVYAINLGAVNAFLIADESTYPLIDTGYPQSVPAILAAIQGLNVRPEMITNIVLTHCHPDHAGGVAEMQRLSDAMVWAHPFDAAVVRGLRPMATVFPSPGLLNQVLYRMVVTRTSPEIPPLQEVHEIVDGTVLPIRGGLRVIHTPGHSAGHVALRLEHDGGLLIAGDACSNLPNLRLSIVYEDLALGQRSLAQLARIPAQVICFGHGPELRGKAVATFSKRWQA
jgi:glyoxylase-like metal-dependent hydrolase (beta-lactamase superfamily II)